MLEVTCSGSYYEIGKTHGSVAKPLIEGTIAFYTSQFLQKAKLDWPAVRQLASQFEPTLAEKWPNYLDEIRGIADGSSLPVHDIIAINVRSEITFGSFSDGCTALAWKTSKNSFLAQNWDWQEAQLPHLIDLTITLPSPGPTIKMITEAGLIGKIGCNSAGVGVCLNAIRARGMDPSRLPCHLGLRMVLESSSRGAAIRALQQHGLASACHMLIADAEGATGVEWTARTCRLLEANAAGQIFHTNHLIAKHEGVEEVELVADSRLRLPRIEELCAGVGTQTPTMAQIADLFRDEENAPAAICRAEEGASDFATLFNIVMCLDEKRAEVVMGRPVAPVERREWSF